MISTVQLCYGDMVILGDNDQYSRAVLWLYGHAEW